MSSANESVPAAVFFARDFLSVEFPRMKDAFAGNRRIYIVVSPAEAQTVRAEDNDCEVIVLGSLDSQRPAVPADGISVNRDRFLRQSGEGEIEAIRRSVAGVCDHILSHHQVAFYLDEPVSGYSNEVFNRRFNEAGALCLHFQTAWLPGYCFFVSDAAQDRPVPVELLATDEGLVRAHIELRAAGLARPAYVIGYGKLRKRVTDLFLTLGKAAYRKMFRRSAAYIDRDVSPHLLHAHCLWLSLARRYSPDPIEDHDAQYVIFPLHYEPESLLSYFSDFSRQEEIAEQILDTLPPGYRLILKEHPSQPGALHQSKWGALRRCERVTILRGDYHVGKLMMRKPVVVSLGSTFALEAAVAGCAVAVLGGVHFKDAPGITRIAAPKDWPIALANPPGSIDAMTEWYSNFLNRHCFRANFMRGSTYVEGLPALVAALNALHSKAL